MASLRGEDRYFAEPNVQQFTSKQRNAKPAPEVDDDADETFSGDLLGCFAVFDGKPPKNRDAEKNTLTQSYAHVHMHGDSSLY